MSDSFKGTLVDNRYEIVSSLGEGGMGAVFLAKQLDNDRSVAIKMLHQLADDEESKKRFFREANLWSRLRHEGIGRFYQYGEWGTLPYIVMEFLPGITVEQYLRQNGKIDWTDALAICKPVCNALQYLHGQSVVHRDLKPANIILCDGDPQNPKLIDFGLARPGQGNLVPSQSLTATGMLVGSYPYMSPEQCAGERATDKSDMYSLGCIMFELISGRQVFEADTPIGVIYKHANQPPPNLRKLVPSAPMALIAAINSLLDKEPDNRPSASSFEKLLDSISENDGRKAKPGRAKPAALAFLVLGLSLITTLALSRTTQQPAVMSTALNDKNARAVVAPQTAIQRRAAALNLVKDASVRQSLSSMRPEEFHAAFLKAIKVLTDSHRFQEAYDLCRACSAVAANTTDKRKRQLESFLAIFTAEAALALGNAQEAEQVLKQYSTAPAHTEKLSDGMYERRADIALAFSLVAQNKLDEAEVLLQGAIADTPKNAPLSVLFNLNWMLADVWLRNEKVPQARKKFQELSRWKVTSAENAISESNSCTGTPDIAYRMHELLSQGYLAMGDHRRQIQHLWKAVAFAKDRNVPLETERLRALAIKSLTGRSDTKDFEDPYAFYRKVPHSHSKELVPIKQMDDAIMHLRSLCSPNNLIAELYLRKCQLLKRTFDYSKAELAAKEALTFSREDPAQRFVALALTTECLTIQRKLQQARKYLSKLETSPGFDNDDSAKTIATQYYLACEDTMKLREQFAWSKTSAVNKSLIAACLVDVFARNQNYSAARQTIADLEKIDRWNQNPTVMRRLFNFHLSQSDWKNLLRLREKALDPALRHEFTAKLASELAVKGQTSGLSDLVGEIQNTQSVPETLESIHALSRLYERTQMFDAWQRLVEKIRQQPDIDRMTCAAMTARLASSLDLSGRHAQADREIENVTAISGANLDGTVTCFLADLYGRRNDTKELERLFAFTSAASPKRLMRRCEVGIRFYKALVFEKQKVEAAKLMTKLVSEIDLLASNSAAQDLPSELKHYRREIDTDLKELRAP